MHADKLSTNFASVKTGVPPTAEIIPFEPDTDNADAGKVFGIFAFCPPSAFTIQTFKFLSHMEIFVNSDKRTVSSSFNLSTLINELQLVTTGGIAIAVNDEVVPSHLWEDHFLKEQDKVLIIRATKGG